MANYKIIYIYIYSSAQLVFFGILLHRVTQKEQASNDDLELF